MKKVFSFGRKVVKNKIIYYILSRYATYLIQFINSIFIAIYLGPFYLGVWGFITLVIQYLNQINFGVAHSVNAIISIHKQREWYVQKVIGASLTMLILLSIIVVLFFVGNNLFNFDIGSKYNFTFYAPFVALIGILAYFNTLFTNVFRVYGRVLEIAINQSAFPLLMLISIFVFNRENLLWALVYINLFAYLFSLFLFILRSPIRLKPIFNWHLIGIIQRKGWFLFIYNSSFYLIIISTRSFVSAFYEVSDFGNFTFAFTLANTILLLFDSFSFLIFPKMLNRFANSTNEKITELLIVVRNVYITMSHLLVHLAIYLFPFFLFFFPQYSQVDNVFRLIAMTIILYTNSFGYQGLLIAKGNEKLLAKLSFLALCINIALSLVLIMVFKVNYSMVILSSLITYMIYVFLIGRLGRKILNLPIDFISIFKDVYPIRLFIPLLFSFLFLIFSLPDVFFIIPLALFLILNFKVIVKSKNTFVQLLTNSTTINI